MENALLDGAVSSVATAGTSQEPRSSADVVVNSLWSRVRGFLARAGRTNGSSPWARRGGVVVAGTIVLAFTAAGCSAGGTADPTGAPYDGDTMTFATSAVPPSLNPAIGDPAYGLVYQWAYDPLVIMNGDGSYSPGLAEEFGYVGEGNQTYEITLREGVKFSDGADLDAEALKTYLDYGRSQTTGTTFTLLAGVESVEVTGPLSVRINLAVPDPGLTFYFAQAFGGGFVISPDAIADPASLDTTTAGAGPYMLDPAETVAGDHYTFVQNPNYWNPERQHWDTVTLRVITNPSSTIQAMQSGQVQGALGDATTLPAARNAGLQVIAPPQALSGINLADRGGELSEPLGDVRVRQALNMAVDRDTIAEALYGSKDLALAQYALEGQAGFDADLNETYPYDPEAAKELLADAGYADGFSLPVLTTPLSGLDKLTQAVAGQLEEVGVNLELTSKATAPDYFTSMVSGEYPAAVIGYGLANMNTLWVGFVNPVGPFNMFHTVDPDLDALYAEYRVADVVAGAELEQQINARLVDQAWTIPVVGAPLSYYLVSGLTGLDATSANAGVPLITDVQPGE